MERTPARYGRQPEPAVCAPSCWRGAASCGASSRHRPVRSSTTAGAGPSCGQAMPARLIQTACMPACRGTVGVERGVVAHVEHGLRRHAEALRGLAEDAWIGLGDAKGAGRHASLEIPAQSDALQVRIAVGERHERIARREEFEGGDGVVVQIDPLALREEQFIGRVGEGFVLSGPPQRRTDAFPPQGAQVVGEMGMRLHDLGADHGGRFCIGQQRGRGRRARSQPVPQHLLGPPDGRPDRPEGIVEIEGHRADAGGIEHGGRE